MSKITIEELLNTEEQIQNLPLKGSIQLRVSGDANPFILREFIRVLRVSPDKGINPYPRSYSDLYTINDMMFVDVNIEVHGETLEVSPVHSFQENTKYVLFVGGKAYSRTNPVTIAGAENTSITVSPPLPYKVEITPKSSVSQNSGGADIFVASITRTRGNNIPALVVNLNDGIRLDDSIISFTDSSVIQKGQTIVIETKKSPPMGDDFILEFRTGSATKIEDIKPTSTSTRVTAEDVMNFYNNPGFMHVKGSSVSGKSSTISGNYGTASNGAQITGEIKLSKAVEVRLPNKVFIHLDNPVTKDMISVSGMTVDIYEAFDNWHLEKMGLYCPDEKIIFEFSIQRSGKVLQIEVISDTKKEVPDDKKWIARWKE